MKIAKLIKELTNDDSRYQAIYELSEPLSGFTEIMVSSINRPKMDMKETMIFGMLDDGVCWDALPGSLEGVLSHKEALEAAGYDMLTEMTIN